MPVHRDGLVELVLIMIGTLSPSRTLEVGPRSLPSSRPSEWSRRGGFRVVPTPGMRSESGNDELVR